MTELLLYTAEKNTYIQDASGFCEGIRFTDSSGNTRVTIFSHSVIDPSQRKAELVYKKFFVAPISEELIFLDYKIVVLEGDAFALLMNSRDNLSLLSDFHYSTIKELEGLNNG